MLVSSWQTMTRNLEAAEMKADMAEEWSITVLRAWVRDTNLRTLSTGWAVGSFRPGDRHRLARDGSRSQLLPQTCQTHQPLPPAILCNHLNIVISACVPRVWVAFAKASCRPDPLISYRSNAVISAYQHRLPDDASVRLCTGHALPPPWSANRGANGQPHPNTVTTGMASCLQSH